MILRLLRLWWKIENNIGLSRSAFLIFTVGFVDLIFVEFYFFTPLYDRFQRLKCGIISQSAKEF